MTEVMTELTGQRNEDLAKKAKEAESKTIPEGRYKFQIQNITVQTSDKEFWDDGKRNVWFGKQQARLQLSLTSRCEIKDKARNYQMLEKPITYFISVCPDEVLKSDGSLSDESKMFGDMMAIAKEAQTNQEVLNYFKDHFGSLHVQYSPEKGQYPARNWNKGISAVE